MPRHGDSAGLAAPTQIATLIVMPPDQLKRSRAWSWWALFWSLLGLLIVSLLSGFWWYRSAADLEMIRQAARAQGFPTTPDEWGRHLAPTEDRAHIERLGVLSKKLKDYGSELMLDKIEGDKKRERLRAFYSIPQRAVEFHAQLDPMTVAEALTILDQLPAMRVVLSDGDPKKRPKDKIGTYRQVARWLSERILLAGEPDVATEVGRTLRFLITYDVESDIDGLIEASLISIVAPNVAARLPDLRSHFIEISSLLEVLMRRLPEDSRAGLVGSFLDFLRSVQNPDQSAALSLNPFAENPWWDRYLNPIRIRAGRASCLQLFLERDQQLKTHGFGHEYLEWSKRRENECDRLHEWRPAEWLPKLVGGASLKMTAFEIIAQVQLALLLAELRRDPWPIDPFDPGIGQLHRLLRDGQVIGAYSLGENQVDDKGDKKLDRPFLLYGPLDSPIEPAADK